MKYYLLIFNENWADEFDVPSIDCKNESEYNDWANFKYLEREKNDSKEKWRSSEPESIYTFLGNSGEGFDEQFEYLKGKPMKEFVKNGLVEKIIVSEEFYKIFQKAKIKDLSLTNIFDINKDD